VFTRTINQEDWVGGACVWLGREDRCIPSFCRNFGIKREWLYDVCIHGMFVLK
jgi:hypothetical protein